MEKVLVVVDMQNDFITGSLGSEEAQAIVSKVREKLERFQGSVIFTRDTHTTEYLSTQEGRNLPVIHCVKDTSGWQIEASLQPYANQPKVKVFDKESFGSLELTNRIQEIQTQQGKIEEIVFVGLCSDICVISNAMIVKAAFPEIPITVDSSCCAGVTKKSHENALEAMKMCQITVV